MKQVECLISGRVQQVMFRDFAQRKARGLWITGTVQNIENGRVRVVAQGREERLNKFVEHLRKGPFLAKVQNVAVEWVEPDEPLQDFTIIY